MIGDGSAHARFRQALEAGDLRRVLTAAADLPRIALPDALRICLLLRDGDQDRYERAAVRWTGRFALEAGGVSLEDIQEAIAALNALPTRPQDAMERLSDLCAAYDLR